MKMHDGTMTTEEVEDIENEIKAQHFASRFNCFNIHKGIRKGELSTVIAPYGMGKSTFIRTMVCELLKQHKKTYLFLSEEKPGFYKLPILKAFKKDLKAGDPNLYLKNLNIQSQLEMEEKNRRLSVFLKNLEDTIQERDVEALIFDNFTTSFLGRSRIDVQAQTVEALKELASKYSVAFILVVHTAKGTNIYQDIPTGENVRGNATTTNVGSYNYVLTTYFRLERPRAFVIVDKARYHSKANKKVFELIYNEQSELFSHDEPSSFEIMQAIMAKLKKNSGNINVRI